MNAVDVHHYLGRSLFGWSVTAKALLRQMDRHGVAGALLVPVKPKGYRLGPANELVARAVAKKPERFAGLCRVDPWQGKNALALLRRGLDELGLKGLYLNPWEECFQVNHEMVDPLVAEATDRDLPVMVVGGHVRVSTAWQIADLARRHPKTLIVATSGGQINISGAALEEAELMLAECPKVFMETSGVYREDFIEDMAKRFGSERILFGSGGPIYDLRFELLRGRWAHLPESDRANILHENALRIFDLPFAP